MFKSHNCHTYGLQNLENMKNSITLLLVSITLSIVGQTSLQSNKLQEPPSIQQSTQYPINTFSKTSTHRLDSFIQLYTGSSSNGIETKILYEYNAQGAPTQIEEYKRTTQPQWGLSQRETWMYNTTNQVIDYFRMDQYDPTMNDFIFGDRMESTYLNGNLEEEIVSYYNNQNWSYRYKNIYTYNTAGDVDEVINYSYMNGQWNASVKYVYSYNTSNLLTRVETLIWTGTTYQNSIQKDYFYNNDNDLIETIQLQYSYGTWINFERFEMTYLTPGLLKSVRTYIGNYNTWDPYREEEFVYDSNNNITQKIYSLWPSNTQSPIFTHREFFSHDNNHPYADLITTFEESDCRHRLLTYLKEDYSTIHQWESELDGTYYWTDLLTSTEQFLPLTKQVNAYPNPATDQINFELPKPNQPAMVQLFNATGQLVLQTEIHKNVLQLPTLSTGIYNYIIKQQEQVFSGQVMIK